MSVLARWRRLAAVALVLSPALPAWAQAPTTLPPAPEAPTGRTAKQAGAAARDMVAAANPLAAEAGRRILAAGGSAVDAAVAAQLVLNLVEPQSSGIGGGAFLLHYDHGRRRTTALDGRETAPAAAKPERFLGPDGKPLKFYDAVVGGRSVGVPGTVRLLEDAHKRFGRLPWARLFEPAIALAEEGFAISPRLNGLLSQEQFLSRDAAAKAYFYEADGTAKAVGTTLRNPAFARTLRAIARRARPHSTRARSPRTSSRP
jgi:gamma-glutamyltranspeptidase/glutathione hydrolase